MLDRDKINKQPISAESVDLPYVYCLYHLGRGHYYYTISEMSGLGVCTVCTIVSEMKKSELSVKPYFKTAFTTCTAIHVVTLKNHLEMAARIVSTLN